MHSNISITDGVYGILSETYVKGEIAALAKINSTSEIRDIEEIKMMTRKLLEKLSQDNFHH